MKYKRRIIGSYKGELYVLKNTSRGSQHNIPKLHDLCNQKGQGPQQKPYETTE